MVTFNNGGVEDYTSETSFESRNESVASQTNHVTTAVAIGDTFVEGFVSVEGSAERCSCSGIAGCGETALSSAADVTVTVRILMSLNGGGQQTDITGQIPSVVVGQEVQLTASYSLQSGDSASGQAWSVGGGHRQRLDPGQPAYPDQHRRGRLLDRALAERRRQLQHDRHSRVRQSLHLLGQR